MRLEDSVIKEPKLEKIADLKLPKEVSKWQDEILNKFYEDVSYLPDDYGVDLSIGNFDNSGYAEGAIVVWNGDTAINFPVIVRNHILSPFDIFRTKEDGENEYQPADKDKVLEELSNNVLGAPSKYHPYNTDVGDIKTPGGIAPKNSLYVDTGSSEFMKNSSYISKDDLNKFKKELQDDGVKIAFIRNTGDVIKDVSNKYNHISLKKKEPVNSFINLAGGIIRKEMNTIIDDGNVDPGNYLPLEAGKGKLVTLRSKVIPSVKDFMDNDPQSLAMLHYAKVGAPVHGALLSCYDIGDGDCNGDCSTGRDEDSPDNEIFISLDGKIFSKSYYVQRKVSYYGKDLKKPLAHGLKLISENTTDNFTNVTMDNRDDGSDFYHPPVKEFDGGKREKLRNRSIQSIDTYDINLIAICKDRTGDVKAFRSNGVHKVQMVDGKKVYSNNEICLVPIKGIKAISQVGKIDGLTFDLAVPDNLKIYAVPEDTIFLNTSRMKRVNSENFLRPNYKIRKSITRVKTANISINDDGYLIESECFEPIKKLANIGNTERLDNSNTIECLNIMGVKKDTAVSAMKLAIKKASKKDYSPIVLIGVSGDYVSGKPLDKIAKINEYGSTIDEYINKYLNFNTVKIASLLNDPESVENILNINFITKENLNNFVDSIEEFDSVREKLAKMLQSSRMGLKDIEEDATKKAMETLGICVKNLRALKGALGK